MSRRSWVAPRSLFAGLLLTCGAAAVNSAVALSSAESSGDSGRGEAIFEGKGNCLSCHRVADRGSYMGPDLSAIGSARSPEELEKALVAPSAAVAPQNRLYRVITADGQTITGRLLNQDVYLVQMLTSEERLVTLKKSGLRGFGFFTPAPMPSYRDKLSAAEQTDLVAYLVSLRGVVKQ